MPRMDGRWRAASRLNRLPEDELGVPAVWRRSGSSWKGRLFPVREGLPEWIIRKGSSLHRSHHVKTTNEKTRSIDASKDGFVVGGSALKPLFGTKGFKEIKTSVSALVKRSRAVQR